jgi:hypothetical protein
MKRSKRIWRWTVGLLLSGLVGVCTWQAWQIHTIKYQLALQRQSLSVHAKAIILLLNHGETEPTDFHTMVRR